MNSTIHYTLSYLLKNRQPVLMIHLLKYLKYENLVKFLLVCKNAGSICDANKP